MEPRRDPDRPVPEPPGIRHAPHTEAEGRHYAEAIVDTIREALLVLTPDLRVQSVNARFYTQFGVRPEDTEGRLIYELGNGQWDIPALRLLLEDILPNDTVVEDYEVKHRFEALGERTMLVNASRLNHLNLILLAIDDVTALRRVERERREAQEVLSESKERYRLLVESVREYAIFAMDPERRITTWNPGAALITGYAQEEVLGRPGDLIFTAEDRAAGAPEAEAATALREGQAADDRWHVRKDGSRFWASGIMAALRTSEGHVRGFAKVLRDNTERKRAEEALRRSRDTFYDLIQNAPFGIYLVDAGFRLAQVSAGAQEVFRNVRPLLGRDFAEAMRIVWPEPFASEAIARFRHTLATGEPYRAHDTTERRADVDEEESYDWQIERITLPAGQPGVVCYFYDFTELRRVEAAVREGESRYRALFDEALDAILLADDTGAFVDANPAAEALLGYERAALLGMTIGDLSDVDEATFRETWAAFLRQGRMRGEYRLRTRRGDLLFVEFNAVAGVLPGLHLSSLRDITERRRAEEALRELNETLEARVLERTRQVRALAARLTAAEQAERHRLAEVLHDDLQQQLFGLSMLLNLLLDAPTPEEQAELYARASEALADATALTRSLSTSLSPPVLASDRLGELLRWLAERKRALHGLHVSVEVEEPCVVPDPDARVLLFRVVQEALFNVAKHAGTNRAHVRAWRERGGVVVQVEDEGTGFDPRDQDGRINGGGFGLSSMRERLRLVGGHFEIEAAPGRGTRVTVLVPIEAGNP